MARRTTRWLGPGIGLVIGLLMTRHAWGSSAPSGDDTMAVIVRANEGLRVLLRGALDGWSPKDGVGYPRFLHYGHGLAFAVGLTRLVTVGLLSTTAAVSLLYSLSFAAVAPAAWFLARSLGMTRRAAMLSGLLALIVNNPFGVGLAGLYTIGLLPHSLAAPFVFVGLGAAIRVVRHPEEKRWAVVLAGVIGVVTITHSISTMVLAFCLAGFVAFVVLTTRIRTGLAPRAVAVLVAGASGVAFSAFWLFPAVATLSERGTIATWSTPTLSSRVDEIISGHFLFGHYVALFIVAGWAWALIAWRRGNPLAAAAPVVGVLFLVFAHWLHVHDPSSQPGQLLANRGVGYAGVLAILPLGGLIDELIPVKDKLVGAVVGVLAAVILMFVVPGEPGLTKIVKHQPTAVDAMHQVAATLRRVVPVQGRFAFERDFANELTLTGVTHPDYWLAAMSGRNNLNIYGIDQTPAAGVDDAAGHLKDDVAGTITADTFARYGVTHVVTIEPTAPQRLVATGQFDVVAAYDEFSVLKVDAPENQPRADRLLHVDSGSARSKVRSVSQDSGTIRLAVSATQDTQATAPLGWSRGWQVRIDGRRVATEQAHDGLLSYTLPKGQHQVAIDYEPGRLGYLGLLVGIIAGFGLWRWARRPSPSAS